MYSKGFWACSVVACLMMALSLLTSWIGYCKIFEPEFYKMYADEVILFSPILMACGVALLKIRWVLNEASKGDEMH